VNRVLQVVFFALVLTAFTQALWQHDKLPEKVAAHFDGAGRANGWMSRNSQTAWHIGTVLFLAGLFQGIALLPSRLPKDYVNLPHRDHWLAPDRAEDTYAWLAGIVLTLGCAVLAFFIALFQLLYQANHLSPPRLSGAVWWFAGGLLALMAVGLTTLLVKFGRKPTG